MSVQQPTAPVSEVEAAWRFFLANWIIIGAIGVLLGASLLATDVSIGASGLTAAVGYVGLYAGLAHADARSPSRRDPQVLFVLGGAAQIVLIAAIMAPLHNLTAAMDFPLRGSSLSAIDRALGFNWTDYAAFVDARPALARWLSSGYAMIRWPIFAIPMILVTLAARQRYRRIEEFTFAFGAALAAITILSALVPAIGVSHQVGFDPAALNGGLRHRDLFGPGGIVALPSFYAAAAALYAWALWPLRRLRPFVVLVVGFMLAAAPASSGHDLVGLVVGNLVAIIAIGAAWAIGQFLARRPAGGTAPGAPRAAGSSPAIPAGALAE